ncbi:MAG TPA: ABC transporter ATP-binding protein [Anaerolineae bacterium]|nr:ABC transporter ATP-binding protein [Anaerolineae bacterium]HQH39582.1 ABC transporter ATP-binding protein [Anaerolineae bacterium]
MPTRSPVLLEVKDLHVHFPGVEGVVRAVDGASFTLHRGETLGLVGESGCGKSVMARSILRIVPSPGRIMAGQILYHRPVGGRAETVELTALDPEDSMLRFIRGLEMALIFQEPQSSLNPVYTIGQQIVEAICLHQPVSKQQALQQAIAMLGQVGMPDAARTVHCYPHQLSGGMCQRAMIALALSCNPNLLIADEPTTALDVTTGAQILELMLDLQHEFGMAILFITHNLGLIAQMTERVLVMYLGRIVEEADVDTLFYHPLHPYTQALLRSIPRLGPRDRHARLHSIRGTVPEPYATPPGCPFHPRCEQMRPGICDQEEPPWVTITAEHGVRCGLYSSTTSSAISAHSNRRCGR